MKKIIISLVFAGLLTASANAQNKTSGVYLSLADFENNKLSYASNATAEKNKIRFNEFAEKPFITIKHNGEKEKLFKDDIFAYRNKGKIVRTWNFRSYNYIEKGPVWIYFKDVSISQGKGIKRERKYYYAVSGQSEIKPLTIHNLKRSFPDNHLFHDLLDAQFSNDAELSLYDRFEGKFKVHHLLETTVLNANKK